MRLAAQFEDVHAGVGAIDDVDVAAGVGLDVVGLDRGLAAVLAVDLHAALVGLVGDRRNEIADFLRLNGLRTSSAHAPLKKAMNTIFLCRPDPCSRWRSARRSARRAGRNCRSPPARSNSTPPSAGSRSRRRRTTPSGAPPHSLRIDSLTIATMSRLPPSLVLGELGDRHLRHREGRVRADHGDIRSRETQVRRDFRASAPSHLSAASRGRRSAGRRPCWCRSRNRPDCPAARSRSAHGSVGTVPVAPGSWPTRPKSRIFTRSFGVGEVIDLRHALGTPVGRAPTR